MNVAYQDGKVMLVHGDCRSYMRPLRGIGAVIADPPYEETRFGWDAWPEGWVDLLPAMESLWCFGSLRMFLNRERDFKSLRLAQEVVWEKQNGSGLHNDRFRKVHEIIAQWYPARLPWARVFKAPQFTNDAKARNVVRRKGPAHWGNLNSVGRYAVNEGGPRLVRSVQAMPNMHRRGIHPTQKPLELLRLLIRYSARPGTTVLDPFSGSGATLQAARLEGVQAIAFEADPKNIGPSVKWLKETEATEEILGSRSNYGEKNNG